VWLCQVINRISGELDWSPVSQYALVNSKGSWLRSSWFSGFLSGMGVVIRWGCSEGDTGVYPVAMFSNKCRSKGSKQSRRVLGTGGLGCYVSWSA
jgi:hypothetical protein